MLELRMPHIIIGVKMQYKCKLCWKKKKLMKVIIEIKKKRVQTTPYEFHKQKNNLNVKQ